VLLAAIVFSGVNILAGYINARNPRVKELNLKIGKPGHGLKSLTISMASDIHLGTIIRKAKAKELVSMLNAPDPDLILLAGDVVDEDLAPVIKDNIGEALCELRARIGVYAITGNHEYIGGVGPAVDYLEKHCIKMLRDTAVFVNGQFYIVGRDDRDKGRFTGKPRKELEEVMQGIDRSYPVILMDHQPFNLPAVAALGVDLQLSGHTHHGQIWPFNYITKAIYELSWGYKKIKNTHFYVSSGFGTWGPPVRLGNRPEVVIIHLTFNDE
jgi:predicted MPP superfamily phosphohydrolase